MAHLFDEHLRPFLDSFLHGEQFSSASDRIHAGDQERNHALVSEIMAGMLRCLRYGGEPASHRNVSLQF